ncbi:hypothetical protein KP509_02G038000 [Ceratopteris richardii]|uniref:protein-serine/threonine phosphatase n=1 Tax=Ceratopteris richardii TaxID=49495 RepID=A0A8T2VCM2_CERRI|nr:hypothetical protein KP509_02G038000 [Ceratopteris richardii]
MSVAAQSCPSPVVLNVRVLADALNNKQNSPRTCASPSSVCPSPHRSIIVNDGNSLFLNRSTGQNHLNKTISSAHSFNSFFEPEEWKPDKENRADTRTSYSPGKNKKGMRRALSERMRPAKLDIPEIARLASLTKTAEFTNVSEQAASGHNVNVHQHETDQYAVASKKGCKDRMEDFYTASVKFAGDTKQAFFGVFDGHGGKHAAEFAAANLGRHISAVLSKEDSSSYVEDAIRRAYTNADNEFINQHLSSGACAVSVSVKDGRMVVANIGDCKAVLCRDSKAESLSTIHRASSQEERQRIEKLGGMVDCYNGTWRVQGTLAVTRSLGDANLKRWISAEPSTRAIRITHDCKFLILASDGLWDQMTDQEVVDCVRKVLFKAGEPKSRPGISSTSKLNALNELIRIACQRGNRDDITVMIVPLDVFTS